MKIVRFIGTCVMCGAAFQAGAELWCDVLRAKVIKIVKNLHSKQTEES